MRWLEQDRYLSNKSLPIQQIVTYPTTRGIEGCAFSSLARGPLADTSAAGCCKPAATSPFWCGRAVPRIYCHSDPCHPTDGDERRRSHQRLQLGGGVMDQARRP